jgi:hypothetical protein
LTNKYGDTHFMELWLKKMRIHENHIDSFIFHNNAIK